MVHQGLEKLLWLVLSPTKWGPQIRITSGPAIERSGDLASLLTNLQDGDILFIDEIHRLNRSVEEVCTVQWRILSLILCWAKDPVPVVYG